MKLFGSLAFSGALGILVITGCKKSNDSSGGSGISATVGGTSWQSKYVTGVKFGGETELAGYFVKSGDTTIISLVVGDSVKVNDTDSLYLTTLSYYDNNSKNTYIGGFGGNYNSHGILHVSSRDDNAHTIAGTFSGVLYNSNYTNDSVKIDNGHFNSSYIVQ
jgi:hypothetical protein